MQMLDAVLVRNSLCNFVKRTLAVVKVWFLSMLCFLYIIIRFFLMFLECRVALIMLWLEDSFNTFILTQPIFIQNEYCQGQA